MNSILAPYIRDAKLLPAYRLYDAMRPLVWNACQEEVYYLTIDINMIPMPEPALNVLYSLGAIDISLDIDGVYHIIFGNGTDLDAIVDDIEYISWLYGPLRTPSSDMVCKSYALDDLDTMSPKIRTVVSDIYSHMVKIEPTPAMLNHQLWPMYQMIDGNRWHLYIQEEHAILDIENSSSIYTILECSYADLSYNEIFRTIENMEIHMHPIKVHK